MKIFLTGACGYKGSVLVPKLLKAGHRVVAFDIMWFGNFLEPHPDLTVVKGDVRNPDQIDLTGVDAIIHLGHSLGLTITAEGVETPEQAAILRKLGCDTAQGYLYGRPDIAVRSVHPSNPARVSVAAGSTR